MTRAEEILQLVEATKPGKAGNPFKHQYSFKPGAKTPTHLKQRSLKKKDVKKRSKAIYSKPWVGDSPDDMPKRLMKFKKGTEKPARVTS